jgi:hypothetical protein
MVGAGEAAAPSEGGPEPLVSGMLASSWRRCAALGAARGAGRLPAAPLDDDDLKRSRESSPLTSLLPVVRGLLKPGVTAAGGVFAVTDTRGVLLWLDGDRQSLRRLSKINFVPGADWSEASAGTNAPGTALTTGRPVQVIGPQHYNPAVRSWSCVAAPVYDPDSGGLTGAVDITGHAEVNGPLALTLAISAARALEGELRNRWAVQDARMLERFFRRHGAADPTLGLLSPGGRVLWTPKDSGISGRLCLPSGRSGLRVLVNHRPARIEPFHDDGYWLLHLPDSGAGKLDALTCSPGTPSLRVLGIDRAVLDLNGRALQLSPRHSEIVLLVSDAPQGLTAGRLAVDLCEDERSTVAVRAEVSRLRNHVGSQLLTSQPYRLTRPLRTDADLVRELLVAGDVRRALEAYPGPLLPHSAAPGVIARRTELEQQLRGALVATGDPGLLRRWVDRPHGRDDIVAWRALARALRPGSPQRAAAVHRLRGLDQEFGIGAATPSLPPRP